MSTQAKDVIEEGVEGVDDALIDSLIDAAHFDDLVLEKDVFDHAKMITVHALLLQMYFTLTAYYGCSLLHHEGYSQSRQPEQLQEAPE